MNAFIDKLLDDDFIWSALTSHLPGGGGNRTSTNYLRFNCPMCPSMGETPDRKRRGGITRSHEGIGYNCFNCNFRTRYKSGEKLPRKLAQVLKAFGLGELEISRLSHRAFQLSRVIKDSNVDVEHRADYFTPFFQPKHLPPNTRPILDWAQDDCDDPNFIKVAEYAMKRGGNIVDQAMWCSSTQWRHRMIVPFLFRGATVGWTGRLVGEPTDNNPKYLNDMPSDYLYNCDVMTRRDRQFLFIPEGVLDAHAIDGISPLGAKLSPRQANWIMECGQTPIIIPDRDQSGQRLIDIALQHNWKVAFPRLSAAGKNWWEADCKDCSDAVKRYGKLYVVRSIIETATDKPLEINVRRKWLV